MTTGLRFVDYAWSGGHEAMLRFGPDTGPLLIAAPPLFEEANRTRALMVGVLRLLAARGIAGALPDLPGQSESVMPTEAADLDAMREAFASAAQMLGEYESVFAWSLRSGALIEDGAPVAARLRLSPVLAGRDLIRELARVRQAATGARSPSDLTSTSTPLEIAGNLIAPALLRQLAAATAGAPARTVRLGDDRREADHRLPGAPPWRRSEPSADPGLIQRLSDDIARWMTACAG